MVMAQARLELRCLDPRCATLLPADAEICDECGGTALDRIGHSAALLVGDAGDRRVAFGLVTGRPNLIGRSSPDSPGVEVDLGRVPRSESVHRVHARIEAVDDKWTVTHLGRNPVVISRAEGTVAVQPGTSAWLRSGDWLQIGRIRLRFIVGALEG
jgi:FHA domain-containing protein